MQLLQKQRQQHYNFDIMDYKITHMSCDSTSIPAVATVGIDIRVQLDRSQMTTQHFALQKPAYRHKSSAWFCVQDNRLSQQPLYEVLLIGAISNCTHQMYALAGCCNVCTYQKRRQQVLPKKIIRPVVSE